MNWIRCNRRDYTTGTALAAVSLIAGATAFVAADFGHSAWLFLPLLLWLATIGLPSTLSVLLVAAIWGRCDPFYGFPFFVLVAGTAAVLTQTTAVHLINRIMQKNP